MDKRGQVEDIPTKLFYWVFVVCFCFTALFLFMNWVFFSYGVYVSYFPGQAEEDLLFYRFVYSADCFAYQDEETGRTYTGVVDAEKFSHKTLNSCYRADKAMAFKLTLDGKELKTSNWKETDEIKKKVPKPVLVINKGIISADAMIVEVQDA